MNRLLGLVIHHHDSESLLGSFGDLLADDGSHSSVLHISKKTHQKKSPKVSSSSFVRSFVNELSNEGPTESNRVTHSPMESLHFTQREGRADIGVEDEDLSCCNINPNRKHQVSQQ